MRSTIVSFERRLQLMQHARDSPDDRAGRVVHELDADLGDTSTGSGAAENLDNLGELDLSLGSLLQ